MKERRFFVLVEIKIKALSKGYKMKDVAKGIGFSKQYMYREIKNKNHKILKRIEKFLS